MLSVAAFGGEANFSHPARPARAAASWRPEWAVKLRTKSTHMGMLGMDMAEMMGGRGDQGEAPQGGQKKKKKSKLLKGLDRVLGQ